MRTHASGFTIIELLIVISIMMVLSAISIASFSSYSTSQKLTTSTLAVKSMLSYAKSQSLSQVNTCPAGQTLTGYKVLACCQGSKCPVCLSTYDYEVDVVCSSGAVFSKGENLPTNISFDAKNSSSFSYTFNTLTGNITGAGSLILTQGSAKQTITVTATGVIQ